MTDPPSDPPSGPPSHAPSDAPSSPASAGAPPRAGSVRVGVMLATVADGGSVDPGRVATAAKMAEDAGFDSVHVGDHLLHPHPMLDSVVALATAATVTERVALGPYVMLLALRDPITIARQLASLAAIAPGRLRLGVGVGGEYPQEFEAAGVPLAERGRRLEESVERVRDLLATGRDERWPELAVGPAAGPVPVLFAGWREVSLRRAARLGDGWIGYLLTPDGFERRRAFLLGELATLDRPRPFDTGMLVPTHLVADGPDAHRRATEEAAAAWASLTDRSDGFPAHLFAGGPAAAVTDRLGAYVARGATELVLAPTDQGAGYLRQVELLATEVLPALRSMP